MTLALFFLFFFIANVIIRSTHTQSVVIFSLQWHRFFLVFADNVQSVKPGQVFLSNFQKLEHLNLVMLPLINI